jgi:hypothetical protein
MNIARCLNELSCHGFALLSYDPSRPLLDLAQQLGLPVRSGRGRPVVDTLVPRQIEDARPNSLSAVAGVGKFPFHTDAAFHREPPGILLMRSVGEPSRTGTLLVHVLGIANEHERRQLRHDLWKVSTPQSSFYTSSLTGIVLRFDPVCMSPIGRESAASQEVIGAVVARGGTIRIDWLDSAKVLILDNWSTIHCREACTPSDVKTRRLERVLVRRLADVGL